MTGRCIREHVDPQSPGISAGATRTINNVTYDRPLVQFSLSRILPQFQVFSSSNLSLIPHSDKHPENPFVMSSEQKQEQPESVTDQTTKQNTALDSQSATEDVDSQPAQLKTEYRVMEPVQVKTEHHTIQKPEQTTTHETIVFALPSLKLLHHESTNSGCVILGAHESRTNKQKSEA